MYMICINFVINVQKKSKNFDLKGISCFQSKLVRAPTPYPKELKAHARHARNYALKKQGSKESDTTDVPNDISQVTDFHVFSIQNFEKDFLV